MSVEFRNVTKTFDRVHAVRNLTLTVEEGEFLVLVGPSGCGKTTALRMVAGLEHPTAGDIAIDGRSVLGLEPRDRDIAMVFQSYALYPHMSVYDNIAFGLRQRRTPRAELEQRVREVAEMLQLSDLLNRRPRELSGGQRQRVALGRAIARRPRVFLMDEPLSNLDAQLRLRTRAELSDLHRRLQATVIYVTHDQVEAMTMGTRIAVMQDGILHQVDTPQRIYEAPANTFVASFIGSPSMNLLHGELRGHASAPEFIAPGITIPVPPAAATLPSPLILGIRPEAFHRQPSPHGAPISGTVTLVEPHGPDLYVTIDAGGQLVTARLDPATHARPGDPIGLTPHTEALHWFDPATGTRLPLGAPGTHAFPPPALAPA